MKKVFKMTMAGFVIMAATAIQAQPQNGDKRPSGEEMIKNEVKKMEEKLSLTAQESEEMKTIYTSFFEKIKDQRTPGNHEANREAITKAEQERDAQVKALLKSDDRFALYQQVKRENQEKMRGEFRQRREGQAPGADLQQLKQKLALTDDQSKKLDEIFSNHHQKMQALRQNGKPGENAEQFNTLVKERDAQVKTLLNNDKKYIIYLETLNEKQAEMKAKMAEKRQERKENRSTEE